MLYDPRWNAPNPSIYTRKGLIEWLEAEIVINYATLRIRALDTPYDWQNPMTCIIAQYLGPKHEALTAEAVRRLFGKHVYYALATEPWTLGAALKRLRGD